MVCAKALDAATSKLLVTGKSPKRKPNQLDNRGSHYYIAAYWAEALASQTEDLEIAEKFKLIAVKLLENEETIIAEIALGSGSPVDCGGYFKVDPEKTDKVMRPSKTFNAIIDSILK